MLPAMTDMRPSSAGWCTRLRRARPGAAALRDVPALPRGDDGRARAARRRPGPRPALMDQVAALQEAWLHRVDALPEGRPPGAALREVRWMLEEYRVSLWAQHLGTAQPVSDTRIRKALERS